MGLLDNFKRYIRGEDYESDEYDEFDTPEESAQTTMRWTAGNRESSRSAAREEAETPRYNAETPRYSDRAGERVSDRTSSFEAPRERTSNVTPLHGNRIVNINTVTQLSVVLVKPEKYENVSEVADHLRDKRTVVLNLESTNRDVARRLLDFLGGVAYANDGKIKRIAQSTYLITPYNVEIQGDVIDELESNGLHL
ncbi:MAG: cell division protein SepF [Oscillospiraceae bacterium]|nr:cell division protein SepF [Oscillospiraceae bacterium]MBQ3880122.1 cell division protein SepF [Oscillospiraceae bacterium]